MQSQSKLSEDYQELLNSLLVLHPDLDLKLTQAQYDDDLDILRAVYLKVTLKGSGQTQQPQNELKPLASLSKTGDFLPAKITYLTQLKSSKLEEQEIKEEELEKEIQEANEQIEEYQNRPKKLAETKKKLKELEFIKDVSYALQQINSKINILAGTPEEVKEEQKDINIEILMNQWNEMYDPITNINTELQEVQDNIQLFKQRNQAKKLKDEEKKLDLLLKIIEAQKGGPEPGEIFSDQEIQKEMQALMEELEVGNLEQAQNELQNAEVERLRLLTRPTKLRELDLQIEKIKRLIQLLQNNNPGGFQTELDKLCAQEEVKTKQDAESKLSSKNLQAQSKANLQRIIQLFNQTGIQPFNDGDTIDPKIYENAFQIPEVDPTTCQQDQAIERAINAMKLYKEMPECFQLSLTKIIYFSTLLLYKQKDELFELKEPSQLSQQLAFNQGSLISYYQTEGFENQEVKQLIYEVQNSEDSKNELQKILKNMKIVQTKHRLFDFQEFQQLLSLNDEAANKLEKKAQDITLLLGSTGCGKSTTVHYLCGSQMKQTQQDDLIHISATAVINQDLKEVKCSPLAKSETRYVTPIDINLAKISQKESQTIILVDTPGSQDTESYEVDISNCLGIIKAVRKVQGVRLVILFSYLKLGARGEDIKNLICFYAGMLQNIDNHLNSFSFFFTHVPQDITIRNLYAILRDGFEQLTEQEKQNESLVSLFSDVVSKAQAAVERKGSQVQILRPLDLSPIKLHRAILQSTPIKDMSAFIERIDQKGKFQVNQQFKLHADAIVSAIKRNDGKYALYLLEELLSFQKIFHQEQVFKDKIKLLVGEVISIGQSLFKKGMLSLEKAFKIAENNNLTQNDLVQFQKSLVSAKLAIDPFYQRILADDKFLKNKERSKEQILSFQYIQHLRDLLEESLDQVIQNTDNLADPLWNRYLQKYLMTLNFFSENRVDSDQDGFILFLEQQIIDRLQIVFNQSVDELTGQTRQILNEMTLDDCNSVEENTNKSPIQQISENLAQLVSAYFQFEDEFFQKVLNKSILEIQESIKKKCINHFRDNQLKDIMLAIRQIKQAQEQIVSEEEKRFYEEDFFFEIKPQHVENITNYFLMHQNLSLNLESISGINSKFLEELQDDIIDLKKQFLQIYFRNEEKLKAVIRKKGAKHRNIKQVYEQIQSLRRVPFIYNETKIRYENVITLLEQFVYEKKQLVQELIPNIDKLIQNKGSRINSPLSQLKDGLRAIVDLKELLPESNQFFLTIVDDLIQKLVQLAETLKSEAQQKQLSFEEIKQIKDLDQIYQQLNDIQQISQIIDEQREILNIDILEIKTKIQDLLNYVEKFLKNKNDPEKQKAEGSEKYNTILINRNQCSNIEQMLLFLYTINQESPLIKNLGLLDKSKNIQKELIQFIEKNAEIQFFQFQINLDIIKQLCGHKSYSIKEENKSGGTEINNSNINMIEIQVNDAVKNICDRLKTFKEIKRYPEQRQYFDQGNDKEESIYKHLRNFLKDLGEQMKTLHNFDLLQFNINISIITNLCVLDSNIVKDEKFNTSFKKIHEEAFGILIGTQGESEKEASTAIEQGHYGILNEIIANEDKLDKLNKQSSKEKIQIKLQKHLTELKDRVNRQLTLTINLQEVDSNIQELDENVLKIIDILHEIEETYIGGTNCKNLKETLVKFYNNLNINAERVKKQSTGLIDNKKYHEAYRIINQNLKMLKQISLNSKGTNQLYKNQTNKEEQEKIKKLAEGASKMTEELKEQLKHLNEKIQKEARIFKECQVPSDFKSMNAKQICDDLEIIKVEGEDCEIGNELKIIEDSIKEIYNNGIEKFKNLLLQKDVTVSFDNKKEISEMKNSLSYVSEKIKQEMKSQIENIEQKIDEKIEQLSRNLSEILQSSDVMNLDFINLSKQLQHRKNNLGPDDKERVDKQCLKMISLFERSLNQDPSPTNEEFQKYLERFYEIQSSSIQAQLSSQTIQKITTLESKIMEISREMFNIIQRQFQSLKNVGGGNKGLQTDTEIKSPLLAKNKFLETFQMMMKIPNTNQVRLNPNFKDNLIQIAKTAFNILNDIEYEFGNCIINNKFDKAIQIMIQLQENKVAIKCLQHQSYEFKCRELKDPNIIIQIDFFQKYSQENRYQNQLSTAFKSQLKSADESLTKMKLNTIIKHEFQILKESLDALEIFSRHDEIFKEDAPKIQFKKIFDDFESTIQEKITKLSIFQIKQYFSPEFTETTGFKEQVDFFTNMMTNLKNKNLEKHFQEIQSQLKTIAAQTCQAMIVQITKSPCPNEKQISQLLIKLQLLKDSFNDEIQKSFSQSQIDILQCVKTSHQFKTEFIKDFHDALSKENIGEEIIMQHKILQELLAVQKMTSFTNDQLTELLKNLVGDDVIDPNLPLRSQQNNNVDVDELSKKYRNFESIFNTYLKNVFDKKSDNQNLLGTLRSIMDNISKFQLVSDVIPDVLAIIFCIFSINQQRQESMYKNFEDFKKSHFQPQPAQVIALLRMFWVGYKNKQGQKLFKKVIDMDLKEENGIVICVASIIFALKGHQVSCACANEFICTRETIKYNQIFSILNVSGIIKYQTLPQICENYIYSSNGIQNQFDQTLQEAYQRKILKNQPNLQINRNPTQKNEKVLLIYNIETLFSLQFQQELMPIEIELQNDEIAGFFKNATKKSTEESKNNGGSSWFNSVGTFIKQVFTSDSKFSSINDGYQELVSLALEQTINEQLEIIQSIQQNQGGPKSQRVQYNLKLILSIGQFLLSEIPKQFAYIMGLTSNFASLDQHQKQIMQKYDIKDFTILPQLISNTQSLQTIEIIKQTENDQFNHIQQVIQDLISKKVSILVIFDTQDKLADFCAKSKNKYQKLSFKNVQEHSILNAGQLKIQVNLVTREDIVGIDFKIVGPSTINHKQGLHVIQTFIADSESEYLNIKGIASSHTVILSNQCIQKHEQSLETWKLFKKNKYPTISQHHQQSMDYRAFVFGGQSAQNQIGKKTDADLSNFLIQTNELFKKAPQTNPLTSSQEDQLSIVIMIDNISTINKIFFDEICKRIKVIFEQQKSDNDSFKLDRAKQLLRFKIYFLGATDKDFISFQIQNETDLEKLQGKQQLVKSKTCALSKTLSSALNDATQADQQINHIVFIGSQNIMFDTLKVNNTELPPIHSYFYSDKKSDAKLNYDQFKAICKDGLAAKKIESSQKQEMLDLIQYNISLAFFLKHQEKMDEKDFPGYRKSLKTRCNQKPS